MLLSNDQTLAIARRARIVAESVAEAVCEAVEEEIGGMENALDNLYADVQDAVFVSVKDLLTAKEF